VGPSTTLPEDGVIAVTFDRYLNPSTVNRQGIALRDEFGNAPDSPLVDYDPVTRVVRFSNPNPGQPWLTVGVPYELQFPIATDDAASFGLRAIDGATIDPTQPSIGFTIAPPSGNPPQDPTIDFCNDVFPIFAAHRPGSALSGLCASASCHASGAAPQGLALDYGGAIQTTAIGVEAVETSTSSASTPSSPEPAFPTGMPIIDPGNPGDSYLLYKLLLPGDGPTAQKPFAYTLACGATPTPPFDYGPSPELATSDEASRLAGHVLGARMPWGDPDDAGASFHFPGTQLSIDDLERIRLWITQGANVADCSQCPATAQ